MCLAVPGQILAIRAADATVDFQGSRAQISLMLVPEAAVGDWVLVHAGFAIHRIEEAEARETWSYLDAIRKLSLPPTSEGESELPHDRPAGP